MPNKLEINSQEFEIKGCRVIVNYKDGVVRDLSIHKDGEMLLYKEAREVIELQQILLELIQNLPFVRTQEEEDAITEAQNRGEEGV